MSQHIISTCIVLTITLSAARGLADTILTPSDPLAQRRDSGVIERVTATRWPSDVPAIVFGNNAGSLSVVGSVLDGPVTVKSAAAVKPIFLSNLLIKELAPSTTVRVMSEPQPSRHVVSGALNKAIHAVLSRLSMIANAFLAHNF